MATAAVVGAGAVGVATALQLQRDGWTVALIDPDEPGRAGASFGNAGQIATHIVEPLAVRSILPKLPRMLLDPTAPLAIRWWYLPTLLPWLVRLLRATAPAEVERISAALASQLAHADAAWRRLEAEAGAEALLRPQGVLAIYPDRAWMEANVGDSLEVRRRRGVPFGILGDNALRSLLPALSRDYTVGVHFTAARHTVDPFLLVSALARRFADRGGVHRRARATGFATKADRVTAVSTDAGEVAADLVVVAAGIWSKKLAAALGARVPLETERGYHVMLPAPGVAIDVPAVIGDARFSVTPMAGGIRLAGTMEFAGVDAPPDPRRHDSLVGHARRAFPGLRADGQTRWMGHRPSLPDSLPVIGRAP